MVLFILQSLSRGSDPQPQVVVVRLKVCKNLSSLCLTEGFSRMVAFLLLRKWRIISSLSLCALMWLTSLAATSPLKSFLLDEETRLFQWS